MHNYYQVGELYFDSVMVPSMEQGALLQNSPHAIFDDLPAKQHPPAVSFIARSGTGKTTLVTGLIAELKSRGYKVGAMKHGSPKFNIDHPGKDSYRFTEAGADNMLISAGGKLAFVKQVEQPPPFEELLASYFPDVDIILVEGFKCVGLPKIEVHRHEHHDSLLCRGEKYDPNLLAVATDRELDVDVPQFDLNRPDTIVDFLIQALTIF